MLARKALAGTAGAPKEYVEDVFSTYLYTGNSSGSSTQTITNNIDLAGDGGLVWIKQRDAGTFDTFGHVLVDSARGITKVLKSNSSAGEQTISDAISSFNADGFTAGGSGYTNNNTDTYVSWTFRKAEKFFDIVTYSGDSVDNRVISHNLGSTPGCILVARRSGDDWFVYHRSLSANYGLRLNRVDSESSNTASIKSVSSTTFTIGTDGMVNTSGSDYVAYLFAHDAGGFGDAGSDSIIKCGSLTTDGSGDATVTLDWEPQWLLLKPSSATGNWLMVDTMRGWNVQSSGNIQRLFSNLNSAESAGGQLNPTATGFKTSSGGLSASTTYIYIAIRRGPMKTPTSGTSVFTPVAYTGNGSTRSYSVGFPTDLSINMTRSFAGDAPTWNDRLRGTGNDLYSSSTQAESAAGSAGVQFDNNTNIIVPNYRIINGDTYIDWCMRRAPGFFDVVCYTGTGSATTITHNLGVAPELIIVKRRNVAEDWAVYEPVHKGAGAVFLNKTSAYPGGSSGYWNSTDATSSVFSLGTTSETNASGGTYIAYLFASLSGVSKVGSYTGNGSSVTVTTDFQPRFIMVKRTDSTGNWIVSDSARGLVAGNDPYLLLNSTAAEDTDEDWVDVSSTGFTVNETSAANANVNTGTYIYLAIA